MQHHLHNAKRHTTHTWTSWDRMMRARWVDPNLRAHAMAGIAIKKHKKEEAIHDFTLSFDTLCADAEITLNPIQHSTVSLFLNALQDDLRTSMLTKYEQEKIETMTWDDICGLAHSQAHAIGKYGSAQKNKKRNNSDG